MKKTLSNNFSNAFAMFEKHQFNELSTIQGGEEVATHTAPEDTTSAASDPDANSSDSDAPAPPVESL